MTTTTRGLFTSAALSFLTAILAQSASADPIVFTFELGSRAASARFERSGSNLIVTLTNNSDRDAEVPNDLLTGLFIDIQGNPALTRTSAVLPVGAIAFLVGSGTDVTPADRVVGGEWAYDRNLNFGSYNQGIAATGYGIFSASDLFPGPNLQNGTSPEGIDFAITSAVDDPSTGNGVTNGQTLLKHSVVFTLGGFTGEPDQKIRNVRFQYGLNKKEAPYFEGCFTPIPEPETWKLMGLGAAVLVGLCWHRWRTAEYVRAEIRNKSSLR